MRRTGYPHLTTNSILTSLEASVMDSTRCLPCLVLLAAMAISLPGCGGTVTTANGNVPDKATKAVRLLNVSYDPTREFYAEFNKQFAKKWQDQTGQQLTVEQSHGGSGKQARAVMDGLEADVVTLALASDIDVIAEKTRQIDAQWQARLPHNSSPYTSTIVFLVRAGNPKGIQDWDDLAVPGKVGIITPNPKTSGGARWNYLAAWGYALKKNNGDEEAARKFVQALYKNVKVLDTGARGSTTTFADRKIGDVLLAWENEALLAIEEYGADKVEIVVPSLSILAEPPVAVVDTTLEKHGTREVATAYLEHLYSPEGQALAAKHFYRPSKPDVVSAQELTKFPKIELITVDRLGGWKKLQQVHFAADGVFDKLYQPGT